MRLFFQSTTSPGGPPHICKAGGVVASTYCTIIAGRWKRKQPCGAAELAATLCMWLLNKMPHKICLLTPAFFPFFSFLYFIAPQQMLGLLILFNILGTAHKTKSKLACMQVGIEWLKSTQPRVKTNTDRNDERCPGVPKLREPRLAPTTMSQCLNVWHDQKYLVKKSWWRCCIHIWMHYFHRTKFMLPLIIILNIHHQLQTNFHWVQQLILKNNSLKPNDIKLRSMKLLKLPFVKVGACKRCFFF